MGKESRKQLLLRFEKERQRNVLARPGVNNFIIVLDQLKTKFNVPKIFRSAEAFGAREVHLVNIGPFDPAPAKGSFRKVPALFFDDFASCYKTLRDRGYTLFCLEPSSENSLCETHLPPKSAFILGHEEWGFSFDRSEYGDIRSLGIPQFGTVQSLNVSIAASIVMYEHVRQNRQKGSIPVFI